MRIPHAWPRPALCASLALLPLLAPACARGEVYRRRLQSPNALERARAAVALARSADVQAVHQLVDLLEDRDPGVRLFAIQALQRLCGTDRGYRYYEDEALRAAAVERWRAAVRAGVVVPGDAKDEPPASDAVARAEGDEAAGGEGSGKTP